MHHLLLTKESEGVCKGYTEKKETKETARSIRMSALFCF